jgi:hypothetical protein
MLHHSMAEHTATQALTGRRHVTCLVQALERLGVPQHMDAIISSQRFPLCSRFSPAGGAQAKSAAQAVAEALTAGGGQAQAFAQALAQAVSSGGCGAVSTVLAGGWLAGLMLQPRSCHTALLTGIYWDGTA